MRKECVVLLKFILPAHIQIVEPPITGLTDGKQIIKQSRPVRIIDGAIVTGALTLQAQQSDTP